MVPTAPPIPTSPCGGGIPPGEFFKINVRDRSSRNSRYGIVVQPSDPSQYQFENDVFTNSGQGAMFFLDKECRLITKDGHMAVLETDYQSPTDSNPVIRFSTLQNVRGDAKMQMICSVDMSTLAFTCVGGGAKRAVFYSCNGIWQLGARVGESCKPLDLVISPVV